MRWDKKKFGIMLCLRNTVIIPSHPRVNPSKSKIRIEIRAADNAVILVLSMSAPSSWKGVIGGSHHHYQVHL